MGQANGQTNGRTDDGLTVKTRNAAY